MLRIVIKGVLLTILISTPAFARYTANQVLDRAINLNGVAVGQSVVEVYPEIVVKAGEDISSTSTGISRNQVEQKKIIRGMIGR